ncbi:hypothetical protein A5836_000196, partial [Enterococcus faecium]
MLQRPFLFFVIFLFCLTMAVYA